MRFIAPKKRKRLGLRSRPHREAYDAAKPLSIRRSSYLYVSHRAFGAQNERAPSIFPYVGGYGYQDHVTTSVARGGGRTSSFLPPGAGNPSYATETSRSTERAA